MSTSGLSAKQKCFRDLTAAIGDGKLAVFCGAGISINSGLPAANPILKAVLGTVPLQNDLIEAILNSGFPFEGFMEVLRKNTDIDPLLDIFDAGEPNVNHLFLAKLAGAGLLATICTTNLDSLLENAFDEEGVEYEVFYKEPEFETIDWKAAKVRIIKIHGSATDRDNMAITLQRVASEILSSQRGIVIDKIFSTGEHENVLVLGYSCSDVFDISVQLRSLHGHRKAVFFVDHYPTPYNQDKEDGQVEDLGAAPKKNPFRGFSGGRRLFIDTDRLVEKLWKSCLRESYAGHRVGDRTDAWKTCVSRWAAGAEKLRHAIAGEILTKTGEYDQAAKYYESGLKGVSEDKRALQVYCSGLGNVHFDIGSYTRSFDYHKKALVAAIETENISAMGMHLNNLGRASHAMGDYTQAIKYYEEALAVSGRIQDRHAEAGRLVNLGASYHKLGRLDEAVKQYTTALNILREFGDKHGELTVLCNLGSIHSTLGRYTESLECYNTGLGIARELGDRKNEGTFLGGLGNTYSQMDQYSKAVNYLEQALDIARKINDRQGMAGHLGNIGIVLFSIGRHERAIACYEEALDLSKEMGDKQGQGVQLGNLGNAYNELGEYTKAIEYYEAAQGIGGSIGDRRGEGIRLCNIGTAYNNLAEHRKAIPYFEKAIDLLSTVLGAGHPYTMTVKEYLHGTKLSALRS